MVRFLIPIVLLLAACSTTPQVDAPARVNSELTLPAMKSFKAARGTPAVRSNQEIALDFLDLSFQMESGRVLDRLTKFRGPVTVAVYGQKPANLERDLGQLLARLRNEANIPITRAKEGDPGNIVVEAIPRKTLQRAVPQAACFVVPNVRGWADFRSTRSRSRTDWARLEERTTATVIIPNDVSPQEVRDCLHEEIAQALGPLNDLYRLPDSTFNDNNFHTVLTGFDMLILKAYYHPSISNGMTRIQAATVLPKLLARINPRGNFRSLNPSSTPPEWNKAVSGALSVNTSSSRRRVFAQNALRIAQSRGWRDNRLAFSLFVSGRVSLADRSEKAITSFLQSAAIYRSLYGNSVQTAHIGTQLAAFALSGGQFATAIEIADDALPPARRSENAALLATLLLLKAEALKGLGRAAEAQVVRNEGLGWGRYGFGAETNIRKRLDEITGLVPEPRT